LIDAGVSADAMATPAIPTIDAGAETDASDADADARDAHD
jgi:hypothetical protein